LAAGCEHDRRHSELQRTIIGRAHGIYQAARLERASKQVAEVAKMLGIQLYDHIIVGKDGRASLKGLKLI
jgi:hypothetical protein